MKRLNRVIILFGPTGVGKTALIDSLSGHKAEIISADSLQVYRGLNIGTAKPTSRQLAEIPHHLIDICHPYEPFTVGMFVKMADSAVQTILSSGHIPVISGGTAYYIKHYLTGLPKAPAADSEIRKKIEQLHQQQGIKYCIDKLQQVDPVSAARINSNDTYRILRALEVYEISGKPLSSFSMSGSIRDDIDTVIIGLYRDNAELHRRIDERVDEMFRQGLPDEVKSLIRSGADSEWPGMKGIGYREFFQAAASGEYSYRVISELIKRNSKAYAKRQMTFFRSLPNVLWLHPETDKDRINQLILNQSF
ncbi:MAG: tRNA (adenosine(37)-N6)-dimethylallyltransferase MiaA [Bacteroidetes bacterium]|nr:tRNA (adenosine(37)-N6)-dimethylallyltransferase MiaA [Bacteroidota bacterium]